MNAAAYIRKSTVGREEDGVERQEGSFDRQKASIQDFARRQKIDIVCWYEEPVSGKSIRKRKKFLQMVKDAKNPSRLFDAIIFEDYSRFMRDIKEAKRYEVELDDVGIKLLFTDLKNDGSTAEEMYKGGIRAMAADYSRDLARKVVQGMLRKARMGCWLGGLPPFGYRKSKDANGCIWLVIYEPEAETVRIIFDLAFKGWGFRKIARWLNQHGIPSSETARKRNSLMNRNLDGRWSGEGVRHLLKNPVYKGVVRWNKRSRVDCFDWTHEGEGTVQIGKLRTENEQFWKSGDRFTQRSAHQFYIDRPKPKEEWVTVEGKAPQIIESEVFDAIQERFKVYSSDKWKRANNARALMTGALVCSICGGNRFHANQTSKIIKATGERVYYQFYRCSGDVRKGSHAGMKRSFFLKQSAVDGVVVDGLRKRINAVLRPERVVQLFEDKMRAFLGNKPNRLAEVEEEIKQIRTEQERMIYAYRKFETAIPEDKVNELKGRLKSIESQRDGLIAAGHDRIRQNLEKTVTRFLERVAEAKKGIELGDPQEKILIREAFLSKSEVIWSNESRPELKFCWRKVPKFGDCQFISTSTSLIVNWLEETEVETYRYQGGELVLVTV